MDAAGVLARGMVCDDLRDELCSDLTNFLKPGLALAHNFQFAPTPKIFGFRIQICPCLRHLAGDIPSHFEKARLKAVSSE